MPYTTPTKVRQIIHTALTDTEIETIITQSDAEINRHLGQQDPTDPLIAKLSTLITAQTIRHRQPESVTIGDYRETNTDTISIEIQRILRLYTKPIVQPTKYATIDEDQRYSEPQ
jgi:hypothetical protein